MAGKCGLFTYAVSFMSWFARNADTNGALRGESMTEPRTHYVAWKALDHNEEVEEVGDA